jgi:fatty acid desaturase
MPCIVGAAPAAGIAAGMAAAAATKHKMKKEGFSDFQSIAVSSLAAGAAHTAAAAGVGAGTDWVGGSACMLTGAMHTVSSFVAQSAVALGKKLIEAA